MNQSAGVLLDTHAAIWAVEGQVAKDAAEAITRAAAENQVFVSVVSAWEIGLLARPRATKPALVLQPDPLGWFRRLLEQPGIRLAQCTPEIAIEASNLPGQLHGDPADRLLIATARALGIPLVTRDRVILAYAEGGHVTAIAC